MQQGEEAQVGVLAVLAVVVAVVLADSREVGQGGLAGLVWAGEGALDHGGERVGIAAADAADEGWFFARKDGCEGGLAFLPAGKAPHGHQTPLPGPYSANASVGQSGSGSACWWHIQRLFKQLSRKRKIVGSEDDTS